MSIVQIYEIQSPAEAELMVELGVDHIGTVLLDGQNWKNAVLRDTIRTVQDAGRKSSLIPLYSDPKLVLETLDFYRPDIVHFCESLTNGHAIINDCGPLVELQKTVRRRCPDVAIMRSMPIAPPALAEQVPTLQLAALFEPFSDYFLTDTLLLPAASGQDHDQPVSGFIGITGQICDWTMARRLVESAGIPVVLAGGITPDNAAEGVARVRPAGVDSCTGTNACEKNGRPIRFKKDPAKVKRLVEVVRAS